MSSRKRFVAEEPFDISDLSESEDDERLNKLRETYIRNRQYSDSEEEVLGVGGNEDSDENESDIALSDIENNDNDDLPDVRAWGKDKKRFYSTDYVDPDYGGFQGKDAHLAELEEEEARNLQKQLAQQLDDDDFALDFFSKQEAVDDTKQTEELVKTDISKLSKRQKLQIFQKESPEFFGLISDYEEKLSLAKDFLYPVLQRYKKGQLTNCPAIDFVQTHYELILNYCTNIYMYLLLKSSKTNVQHHPIIKRLYQYRQLLIQLEAVFQEVMKPQIELLLLESLPEESDDTSKVKNNKLKLLSKLLPKAPIGKNVRKGVTFDVNENPSKKMKLNENVPESEDGEAAEENPEEVENETEETKRAISYKMYKNKGLTPHRKKEQRNPRVKHRQKFRKALIRRKGAVRNPRTEMTRYSGEISGIKASVSKSIKIKT